MRCAASLLLFASRPLVATAALICLAVMLVSVNLIAARFAAARLDPTADRLYTLSPGTLKTLARIDEPITLRLYYSHRLGGAVPSYDVHAARVRQMLDQYVAAAHGKVRLEVYDPPPFSDLEDRAVAAGLQAVPLDAQGDQVYFGLVGSNSTDDRQVIPVFSRQRERFLEYDLAKLVRSLAVPKKTVVGLLTSLPLAGDPVAMMQGRPSAPTALLAELRQLYTVRFLDGKLAAIPPDIDVLMLAEPPHLSPQTLYAIDQFVLKGGKALVFVDPYAEAGRSPFAPPAPSAIGNLAGLFKAWGIAVPAGWVAGDRRAAQLVSMPSLDHGLTALRYVAWLDLDTADLNRHDMITTDLSHMTMATAGIVEPLAGRTTRVEPLITTSPEAEKIPVARVEGMPDAAGLLARFAPAGTRDMLDDRFWARSEDFFGRRIVIPVADNGDFVADAIEILAGGEDLVDLRSRGTSARPFVLVDRIRRAAQIRYSAEEHALEQNLKATEAKIAALTGSAGSAGPASLSPQETQVIAQFRAALIETRRQLRDVQAALRSRIERLQTPLEFFDIALVPILVALVAVIVGIGRVRRRGRRAPLEV